MLRRLSSLRLEFVTQMINYAQSNISRLSVRVINIILKYVVVILCSNLGCATAPIVNAIVIIATATAIIAAVIVTSAIVCPRAD